MNNLPKKPKHKPYLLFNIIEIFKNPFDVYKIMEVWDIFIVDNGIFFT